MIAQSSHISMEALQFFGIGLRNTDKGDAPVAGGNQILDGLVSAFLVIGSDTVNARVLPVSPDDNHRQFAFGQPRQQFVPGRRFTCGDDNAVHAMVEERFDTGFFAFGAPFANADERAVSARHQHFLNAADQLRRKRIGNVGQQNADDLGTLAFQTTSQPIGVIIQLAHDFQDFVAGGFADVATFVDDPRNSHRGHTSLRRDVANCRMRFPRGSVCLGTASFHEVRQDVTVTRKCRRFTLTLAACQFEFVPHPIFLATDWPASRIAGKLNPYELPKQQIADAFLVEFRVESIMAVTENKASWRTAPWFKPLVGVTGALVLLLIGWLALPYLININNYRPQIISQLEQQLGRKVKLGTLKLGVWPTLRVNVEAVQIGEDPQIAPGDFVQAKAVRLRVGWLSLLRGNPQVAGLELVEPNVTLIKATPQQWNWSSLKPLQEPSGQSAQAPLNLQVTNGSFTLIDRTLTPPIEKNFSGVNVRLNDFAPRRAFDFAVSVTMPGAQTGQLELSGAAGPLTAQDASQTPLDARLKMEQVDLSSLEALLGQSSTHAGKLTMDATIAGKLAEGLRAAGQFKATDWRLIEGVEPARTPLETQFKLTAIAVKNAAGESEFAVQLEQCDLTLGNTSVSVTGQLNQLPTQPAYDLQIRGDRIALDSLLESSYALGFGPPAGTKASGAGTLQLQAKGNPQSVALQGTAEIRELKFQSAQLPQAMQVSELKLSFTPQAITAAPFRSTLSQTTVDFKGLTISEYGQLDKAPRAHLEISTSNAQLGDLLHIAEAFGARPDATGSGTASLSASIDTTLAENSAPQITGQGKLSGARLQPTQLKKPLEIANADLRFTGDSTRIDNLQTQLGASQASGWLQVKSFAQRTAAFDLQANQINVSELQAALNEGGAAGAKSAGGAAGPAWRADGKLTVGKLQLETLTATNVQSNFTMQNQVMTLAPVTLQAFGGNYQGSVRVNQAQTPPDLALQGKFNGVDINQLLSSSGQQSMIYGQAAGSIDVRGRGQGGDQLAQSLIGNGSIAISNGKFTSFDLMKQVEVLGKFANLPTGGAGTAFRSLKTNLRFDQGRLTMDALSILMEDLQVSGDGAMQLGAAPTVNYDLLVRLSPGLSKRLTGSGATPATNSLNEQSGAATPAKALGLTAVVGNFFMDQGVVALPLKVAGPLKQPSFGLNTSLLQKRATNQLKENLLERFLPKDKQAQSGATEQTEQDKDKQTKPAAPKPADLLKGVFDKLRKKDKP